MKPGEDLLTHIKESVVPLRAQTIIHEGTPEYNRAEQERKQEAAAASRTEEKVDNIGGSLATILALLYGAVLVAGVIVFAALIIEKNWK